MADIKLIYKNADGLDNEHSAASDSIQFLSYKTATKELTDTKVSHLVDGADAADEHIHDARYFRENEFINASTGSGDAAKPIITNSSGKVDTSLIDVPATNALFDHGTLLGLSDDDHTQYLLTDGTRNVTGVMSYSSSSVSISADANIPTKKYVDDSISSAVLGEEWFDSALTRTVTPPASPATGARYLIDLIVGTPTGVWVGKGDQVATWNGSSYTYQTPKTGSFISIDDENTGLYYFNGTAWAKQFFEDTTASTGLVKVGVDIRVDSSLAGDGLGFTSGVMKVNVDGSSIEINSDTLRVKALGIKDSMIDFGTSSGQVSAADIPIADTGSFFPTDDLESATQFLAAEILNRGVYYTADTGGITKGQLVYVSANDKVLPYSNLANSNYVVGIALSTVAAASQVKVLANNTVLAGVISGATAGTRYYWNGTALTTTIPTTSGANVWAAGIAKNATDLMIEVMHVKKNAA